MQVSSLEHPAFFTKYIRASLRADDRARLVEALTIMARAILQPQNREWLNKTGEECVCPWCGALTLYNMLDIAPPLLL